MTIRQAIQRDLRNGQLTGQSELHEVRGIGPYLATRLARSLRRVSPITVATFWTATSRLTTPTLGRTLHRALQNERGNQCVATRVGGAVDRTYHTGDVNQFGYEACVTLLDYNRVRSAVRYGVLPAYLPERPRSAKTCGCRSRGECGLDALCVLTQDGGCVPRAQNSRGFVGVSPHPGQKERAATDQERRSVRRRSHVRASASLRNDPDSAHDVRARHSRTARYSRRGNYMWRHPGSKVRWPARAF